MILRAPQWKLPKWLQSALLGLWLLAASPVILALVALFGAMWIKRWLIGPANKWRRWFAWYPVRTEGRFGPLRWLEVVERQSYDLISETYYREPHSDWERW